MGAELFDEDYLMTKFGFARRGALEKCLRQQGIKVYRGEGGRLVVPSSEFQREKETTEEIQF